MKVVRVLYTINNLQTAGMKFVLADLVRGLDRSRFSPLIAVGRKTGSTLEREMNEVCPVLELPLRIRRRPRVSFTLRIARVARSLRSLADVAHSFDYASDWTEGLAMKLAGVPWVAEKTNLNWDARRWWLRSLLASRIVCLSNAQAQLMGRWAGKLSVIPTGIDVDRFETAEPLRREDFGFDRNHILVVSLAHLVPVKGHRELLRAVAELSCVLPNLRLLLAGDGNPEYVKELKTQAASLGVGERVSFLGAMADTAGLLKMCDAKILATRNVERREAFGAAIVEAMAAGLPVIATKSGGPEDIVLSGETGWLVEAEGHEPLVAALRELCQSHERRRRAGAAGLLRARILYNKGRMVEQYQRVYEAALGRTPLQAPHIAEGFGKGVRAH
jgi:glycosyltransferase involved in cell wall biosynthesis